MYKLNINFKMPDGSIHQLQVDHVWTFRKITRMLEGITGMESSKMKLIYAGRYLNPSKAFMNDSCLMTGSTVNVLV